MDNFKRMMLIILFVTGASSTRIDGALAISMMKMVRAVCLLLATIADRLQELTKEVRRGK
jgi:hypothetical protein